MVNLQHLSVRVVCIALLLCATAQADVRASVDTTRITEDETLILTLRTTDAAVDSPRLSDLEVNFTLINQQQMSRITTQNGRLLRYQQWQLELAPKHTGNLQIPALTLGQETTDPIWIQVVPLSEQQQQALQQQLFIKTELSHTQVYINQPFDVTFSFYFDRAVQAQWDAQTPWDETLFDIVDIQAQSTQAVQYQGRSYTVAQRHLTVIPKQAGTFTLSPISVSGEISGSSRRRFRVSSAEPEIIIRPVPDSFPKGATWLPATQLTLSEHWSDTTSPLTVGSHLTRTLSLQVEGQSVHALPEIPLQDQPYFRAYAQPGQREGDERSGKLTQQWTLVLLQPGQLTLPQIRIPWWNTQADRLEYAQLPAHSRQLTGQLTPHQLLSTPQPTAPLTVDAANTSAPQPTLWLGVALISNLIWLAVVVGLLYKRSLPRLRTAAVAKPDAQQAPVLSYKQLAQYLMQHPWVQGRQQLLHWATQHYAQPFTTLQQLQHFWADDDLSQWLQQHERTQFGPDADHSRSQPLSHAHSQQLLQRVQHHDRKRKRKTAAAPVTPLYPL